MICLLGSFRFLPSTPFLASSFRVMVRLQLLFLCRGLPSASFACSICRLSFSAFCIFPHSVEFALQYGFASVTVASPACYFFLSVSLIEGVIA